MSGWSLSAALRQTAVERRASIRVRVWRLASGPPRPIVRLVLQRIQGVSSSRLATATGLSPGYCALVRSGKRIPHAVIGLLSGWQGFRLAVDASRRLV
jgi:hypothetical protein